MMYTVEQLKQKFLNDGVKKKDYNMISGKFLELEIYYLYADNSSSDSDTETNEEMVSFFNPLFKIDDSGSNTEIVNNDNNQVTLRYNHTMGVFEIEKVFTEERGEIKMVESSDVPGDIEYVKTKEISKFKNWDTYDITEHNCVFFNISPDYISEVTKYKRQYYNEHIDDVLANLNSYAAFCEKQINYYKEQKITAMAKSVKILNKEIKETSEE